MMVVATPDLCSGLSGGRAGRKGGKGQGVLLSHPAEGASHVPLDANRSRLLLRRLRSAARRLRRTGVALQPTRERVHDARADNI